jgi:hypothetical protein
MESQAWKTMHTPEAVEFSPVGCMRNKVQLVEALEADFSVHLLRWRHPSWRRADRKDQYITRPPRDITV